MNREETLAIMSVLKAAYPNYYKDMKRHDADAIVSLWTEMFADEPARIVAAAVKAHIATDQKGFPPNIGAIKNSIVKLTKPPELGMSEMEAWNLVRQAIRGASMDESSRKWRGGVLDPRTSAEVNFERLPELLRRIVGSPRQLADWEQLDDDKINTVLQSNFMRSFRARASNEREYLAMPSDIRQTMESLTSEMKANALGDGGMSYGGGD